MSRRNDRRPHAARAARVLYLFATSPLLGCDPCDGVDCPYLRGCVDGECECGADPWPEGTLCEGVCVDTLLDPDNCGACGAACSTDEAPHCHQGECSCGGRVCEGACVSLGTPENCGDCGRACGPSATCIRFECVGGDPGCPLSCDLAAGEVCCNTGSGPICANIEHDRDHCAGCGLACEEGSVCHYGECEDQGDA